MDHAIIINKRRPVSCIIHTILGISICWKVQIQPYVAYDSTDREIWGCLVLYLITTSCKSDEIWYIISIRRIKYGFMRVNIQILNANIETLETRNSRCHSLGYQVVVCVTNINSDHNRNLMYPSKSMAKFTMIFHLFLTMVISC